MIKQETKIINNKTFIRTYSDENKYILQVETGYKYSEAIDVTPLRYTYIETDVEIEVVRNKINK
jgi:hypothetical protein